MQSKQITLAAIILSSISFGLGWLYGFKQIPPSTKSARPLRGQTDIFNSYKEESANERFELSLPKPDAVFLGDSITQASAFNETFSTPARIYNRGVSGDTTVDILNRLQEIKDLQPKNVYLMIGINDLYTGATPTQVAENISKIHDALSKEGIKTIVQETIQCQPSKCPYTNEVNNLNKILALKFKAELLSLGELSSINGLSENLTYDGIHLNKKGYEAWANQLRQTPSRYFK